MDCKIRDSPEVERGRVCVLFLSTQLLSRQDVPQQEIAYRERERRLAKTMRIMAFNHILVPE